MKQVLIIGSVWPEPGSSAAGSRMVQLITLFLTQKWKVIFASTSAESEHMADLESLGVERVTVQLNDAGFDAYIKELQPAIVMFDRFMVEEQFGWRVAEHCPQAVRVLDTEDLHCLRKARQQAFKEGREFETTDLMSDIAKREVASILRCDLSLMISDVEMSLLQEVFKVDVQLLYYIPFMLEKIDVTTSQSWKAYEEREHFVTIGNFLHEPNWNSVLYLKETIWPLIRKKLPKAQMHVYGAYASQRVLQLHNPKQGFCIKGRADDAKTVMSAAKVCLAPLRFGAGIKGKLIEAMQCGTPSVTTAIGAESMHGDLSWNGVIANGPEKIAAAAVHLYTDKIVWGKAQKNGVKIVNEYYPKASGEKLIQRILDIQHNLKDHRFHNFTGAMLMHHTLKSTKYMSQWIALKNKFKS